MNVLTSSTLIIVELSVSVPRSAAKRLTHFSQRKLGELQAWSRRRVTSSAASDGPVDGAPAEPPRARARAVRPSHCGRNATSARRPHQLESTRWMRRCRGGSSRRATRRRRRVNLQGRPTAAWHLQGGSAIAPNAGGRGLQVRRRVGAPVGVVTYRSTLSRSSRAWRAVGLAAFGRRS